MVVPTIIVHCSQPGWPVRLTCEQIKTADTQAAFWRSGLTCYRAILTFAVKECVIASNANGRDMRCAEKWTTLAEVTNEGTAKIYLLAI